MTNTEAQLEKYLLKHILSNPTKRVQHPYRWRMNGAAGLRHFPTSLSCKMRDSLYNQNWMEFKARDH